MNKEKVYKLLGEYLSANGQLDKDKEHLVHLQGTYEGFYVSVADSNNNILRDIDILNIDILIWCIERVSSLERDLAIHTWTLL